MKILILEDEPLVADQLIGHVKNIQPDAEIAGPLPSVRETKAWMAASSAPDLILADIQLSDGASIDLFSYMQPVCPIIFTTAFNEYAIRAFKVNSIDYLLKPVQYEDLKAAFEKYHMLQEKYVNQQFLNELSDFIKNKAAKKYKRNFIVHQGNAAHLISDRDISGFSKDDLIFLLTSDNRRWVMESRSLDEIENVVDPELFFRANRQWLISRKMITGYKADVNGKLILKTKWSELAITISREKATDFKLWLEREA